jgi:transposase
MKRKTYESDFKVRVVLESLQRNTTIEQIRRRYQVSASVVNKWRAIFKEKVHLVFEGEQPTKKISPAESPEELKKIIGELTVENALLKKALSVWD